MIHSPSVLMPPCTNVHPLLASGVTAGDKALGKRLSADGGGGHRRGWQGPHRRPLHSAVITLPNTRLCTGPTFAVSLSPLAPACQRAQAAAFLTLGPPLADRAGQGAAWLLCHIWGWQKASHRGPAWALCPAASTHGRGQQWLSCPHGLSPEGR